MNLFDSSIVHLLIGVSQKSPFLDSFMALIVDNELLKGGVVVSLLWFLWFRKSTKTEETRQQIIITVISCFFAISVGRLLARVLTFRARPLVNADLTSFFPNKSVIDGLDATSSFPSDHAVMFFALATGIFLISKRLGIFSYFYVFFVICFPRIYLGLHYPTDILFGAVIGIVITFALSSRSMWQPITRKIIQFSTNYTGLFYVLFFLLSFEISTLFVSGRLIVHFLFSDLYEKFL